MSRLSGVCVVPRQIEDPVEVRADDRVLGRAHLHVRRRLSCFFATCSASVGRFAFAMRSSSPSRSPWSPSSSPSSSLMALSCWRRTYSRWFLPISSLIWELMRSRILRISSWRVSSRSTLRMRSFTSTVSRSCAFSSTGASRFAATRSASAPGAWIESMSEPASRGSSGMSWMTCLAMSRRLIASASASSSSSAGSSRRRDLRLAGTARSASRSSSRMRVRPWRMSE